MPRFNPDSQLNIHDLTIEEPEKKDSGAVFDLERDITSDDRAKMHNRLEELREEKGAYQDFGGVMHYMNWIYFAEVAADMTVIGEDPKITQYDLLKIKDELYFRRKKKDWQAFARVAVCLTKLGHKPNLLPEDIEGLKKQTEEDRLHANSSYAYFASMVEAMKFLGQDVEMSDIDWERLEQGVTMSKLDFIGNNENNINGRSAGGYFAQDIILGRNPEVTKEELILIKNDLDRCRNITTDHYGSYELAELAASLTIISAEKVEITDKGLEITMPKEKESLQSDVPAMPEQKQF